MLIMKVVINLFNSGAFTLADYFINTGLINNLNNALGVSIQPVILQPLLDGSITNPSSVSNCPNMWYMCINAKNSVNLSIDTTSQNVFNQSAGTYMGLSNSSLCDIGTLQYNNSELNMLGTVDPLTASYYFANCLYLGLNTIGSNTYYMLIVLPEALFNGNPINTASNTISIYSANNTVFYFNFNSSSSSAFTPQSNTITTSTTSSGSTSTNSYTIGKVTLSVSNLTLF